MPIPVNHHFVSPHLSHSFLRIFVVTARSFVFGALVSSVRLFHPSAYCFLFVASTLAGLSLFCDSFASFRVSDSVRAPELLAFIHGILRRSIVHSCLLHPFADDWLISRTPCVLCMILFCRSVGA